MYSVHTKRSSSLDCTSILFSAAGHSKPSEAKIPLPVAAGSVAAGEAVAAGSVAADVAGACVAAWVACTCVAGASVAVGAAPPPQAARIVLAAMRLVSTLNSFSDFISLSFRGNDIPKYSLFIRLNLTVFPQVGYFTLENYS